jgi:hypothetical protein
MAKSTTAREANHTSQHLLDANVLRPINTSGKTTRCLAQHMTAHDNTRFRTSNIDICMLHDKPVHVLQPSLHPSIHLHPLQGNQTTEFSLCTLTSHRTILSLRPPMRPRSLLRQRSAYCCSTLISTSSIRHIYHMKSDLALVLGFLRGGRV